MRINLIESGDRGTVIIKKYNIMEVEMSAEKVKKYFEQVVDEYSCGNVRVLLDAKLPAAGPLLFCVVNGIDLVGGMMCGFRRNNSQARSVKFMERYLKLSPQEAKLVYSLVRCGVTHEGTTKLAITYFVDYKRLIRGTFLYKDNAVVWLNVTELAFGYLEAIAEIAKNVGAHLWHFPEPDSDDETVFTDALGQITADLTELRRLAAEDQAAPERRQYERGEIEYMSSSNPFFAERFPHFTVAKI